MIVDLPVFRFTVDATLTRALQDAAHRVIASDRYILGQEVASFEREFAEFCGSRFCVGVANGTDALELALRAVGVERGGKVVTVANAGGYSTAALRAIGAKAVYTDVGEDLVIDDSRLHEVLADASAIVVTHLYGRMAAIDRIVERARDADVPVIEDCAQAHGAARNGRLAGTFGALGCFSFYPTKNLGALGDAGAVITSDPELASRVRSLGQYGWATKYRIDRDGGRNSRLDEMQAGFLRAKLPYLSAWNAARVVIAARYRDGLRGLVLRIPDWRAGEFVAHLFVVRCDDRDALRRHLADAGIGTAVHYPIPDHSQLAADPIGATRLPVTEQACRQVLTLPCYPGMTNADTDRVIEAIHGFYGAIDGNA